MIRAILFSILALISFAVAFAAETTNPSLSLVALLLVPGFITLAYFCYEKYQDNKRFWKVVKMNHLS